MPDALTKVDVPLSERYTVTCARCGYLRQVFGTAEEARKSAEAMGWEFQCNRGQARANISQDDKGFEINSIYITHPEIAYCPHCALLTKETL